ncbi:hypothetical protein F2Q70_00011236 [Brassica cretica]|uniref:Uncharacterized protein n=1 Tax=Brassica cretica TaxID=69181 RepID=A0A8S9MBQ5_BRACR|nr:hypothetical protein F2Q70_00011236 [Brassica cretica]KAF3548175.1 hypothetical protein DY000_02006374 [Brassica cretica]
MGRKRDEQQGSHPVRYGMLNRKPLTQYIALRQLINNEQLNLTVLTRDYGTPIRANGDASPVDHGSQLMIMVWINGGRGAVIPA